MDKKFIVLAAVVFLSRIPFLFDGYGHEEDSWGLALNAIKMADSGIYEASRLPGHPLQEYCYAFLAPINSAFTFNLLSALMSVAATLFFSLILRKLKVEFYLAGAFCFAMIPAIYSSSTYSIDFMWAAAFSLGSFYFFLEKRIMLAGILLGLAVACRITSGAWLLAFLPFIEIPLWKKEGFIALLKFILPMGIVSVLFYLPVLNRYGTGFFMYYDQFPYPALLKVIYKMTLGVWGLLGFFALVIFLPGIVKNAKQIDKRILISVVIALILFSISYLRLPQKSGYMIPLVPFVLILFFHAVPLSKQKLLILLLALSPFLFGINLTDDKRGSSASPLSMTFISGQQEIFLDPLYGPIFNEKSKRVNKGKYTDGVIQTMKTLPEAHLIAGWWYNELAVKAPDMSPRLHFYLSEKEMIAINNSNPETVNYQLLFFLPEQELYNDLYSSIHTTKLYAKAFPEK